MEHLQSYQSRTVVALPTAQRNDWQLKRYVILSKDRKYDSKSVSLALDSALERLPVAGKLGDVDRNHGVGFQIVHFAEVAIVSPVFYWMWGSVLANVEQMRAQWSDTEKFETGVGEVVGCVWEMEIVCFEVNCWRNTMLVNMGDAPNKLSSYLKQHLPSSEPIRFE